MSIPGMTITKKLLSQLFTFTFFFILPLTVSLFATYVILFHLFTKGFYAAALTWSFFVLCVPGGTIGTITLPIQLITGYWFHYFELAVWLLAVGLNIYTVLYLKTMYFSSMWNHYFYRLLMRPIPCWFIFALCAFGMIYRIIGTNLLRPTHAITYHLINACLIISCFIALLYFSHEDLALLLNAHSGG